VIAPRETRDRLDAALKTLTGKRRRSIPTTWSAH
jgi:hypothetical protein